MEQRGLPPPGFEPANPSYKEQENAIIDHTGQVVDRTVLRRRNATLVINALDSSVKTAADFTDNNNFYRMLTSHIMISNVDTNSTGHMRTRAHAPIDFWTLAARWMISPEQSQHRTNNEEGRTNMPEPHYCPTIHTQQMTGCYGTSAYRILCSQIQCLPEPRWWAETSVDKFIQPPLGGAELTQ